MRRGFVGGDREAEERALEQARPPRRRGLGFGNCVARCANVNMAGP